MDTRALAYMRRILNTAKKEKIQLSRFVLLLFLQKKEKRKNWCKSVERALIVQWLHLFKKLYVLL